MRDKERWAQIVKSVHFFESALDNRAAMKRTVAAMLSKACVCGVCDKKFASERALAAYAYRVHGYRTEWSKRVDCDCQSPMEVVVVSAVKYSVPLHEARSMFLPS